MSKRLDGFNPLKPGRIHMRCPKCGRKQSNMPRDKQGDPESAVLIESCCPNCDQGGFTDEAFFAADGTEIRPEQ